MDPIKINVEVSFQEATLEVLKALVSGLNTSDPSTRKNAKIETKSEESGPKCTKSEPKPAESVPTVQKNETKAEAAPAQASGKAVTDAELREAVKACKDCTSVAFVRNTIFAKYGIESSVECPAARRSELLTELKSYTQTAF